MMQSIRIDIIYFRVDRDTKMEFRFNDFEKMPIRTLATSVKERDEFLYALKRGVYRSDTVIVVGGMNGNVYLPGIIGAAIGAPIEKLDYKLMGFAEPERPLVLPKGSIPLVTEDDEIGGMLLEKGRQSIIVLSEDAAVRHKLLDDLVFPYIFEMDAGEVEGETNAPEKAPLKPNVTEEKPQVSDFEDIFSSSAAVNSTEIAEEITPEPEQPELEKIEPEEVEPEYPEPEEVKSQESEGVFHIAELPEDDEEDSAALQVKIIAAEPEVQEKTAESDAVLNATAPNISNGMFVIAQDEDDESEEDTFAAGEVIPFAAMSEANYPSTEFTAFVDEEEEAEEYYDDEDYYQSNISFAKVLGVIVALLCIGGAAAIFSMLFMGFI